jgi:hypothetical protein
MRDVTPPNVPPQLHSLHAACNQPVARPQGILEIGRPQSFESDADPCNGCDTGDQYVESISFPGNASYDVNNAISAVARLTTVYSNAWVQFFLSLLKIYCTLMIQVSLPDGLSRRR